MKLSDFDFGLPEALIATRPARPRSASRLLVATHDRIEDSQFNDLPRFLRRGDRLVLNDTKVLAARLTGIRERVATQGLVQARIEVTLLEQLDEGHWRALLKPLRKVRVGEVIRFSKRFRAVLTGKSDGAATLRFNVSSGDFEVELSANGVMPLPPYIAAKRAADTQDFQDYQTVWARHSGAVAAPTASLHYDDAMLERLREIGVAVSYVTLHVGAGTFIPIKVNDVTEHKMHAERGEITAQAAEEINNTQAEGGRIIPVGTTALRLLETAAVGTGRVQPWQGMTDIFIKPGFQFQMADALITNFHLPKSTLLLLVSAFMGIERVHDIYAHAITSEYRFYSYGDASLLLPQAKSRPG